MKNINLTDGQRIVKNYICLHADDGIAILYCGLSIGDENIIGSLLDENEEKTIFTYIQFCPTFNIFNAFMTQQISYLDVWKSQSHCWILKKDINDNILDTELKMVKEIPKKYHPIQGFYCPKVESK